MTRNPTPKSASIGNKAMAFNSGVAPIMPFAATVPGASYAS